MTQSTTAAPRDVASFIARMSADLAELAKASRLDLLAYLLDVARAEAEARSRESQSLKT